LEQHEADLVRDLIKASREIVVANLDAQSRDISSQGRDIVEIKVSLKLLQEEYDAVLVQATKTNAEVESIKRIIKLGGGIVSGLGGIATFLYYLALLHII